MSQFQSYSASKGPVSVASLMDCSITEYLPVSEGDSSASRQKQNAAAAPFQIDYSRFINEISSKRQPSQLREISNNSSIYVQYVPTIRRANENIFLSPCLIAYLRAFSARVAEKLPANCVKFGVGVPNVLTFPFKKISVELITGENIQLQGSELSDALQYLPSVG